MATNKFLPHVLGLPEVDANRQIARGFRLDDGLLNSQRQIQVLPIAGGWCRVVELFLSEHVREMDRYTNRFMILLVDFDGSEGRRAEITAQIPLRLSERVFILGSSGEPEDLRRDLAASYECIGSGMAKDCRAQTSHVWGHKMLLDNTSELIRLRVSVCPFLFEVR